MTVSAMIDQVARAIGQAMPGRDQAELMSAACAAIAAMREPSKECLSAVAREFSDEERDKRHELTGAWLMGHHAFLDAALAPTPTNPAPADAVA